VDILSLISRGSESQPSDPSGSVPLTSGHVVSLHPSWDVIDATKLKTFSVCMRKGFLQYILGWDSDYKNHDFIFGEAGHLAQAHLINEGYTLKAVEEAFNIFLTRYRKDFSEITDVDFHPKSPINMSNALISYVQEYREDKFEVLYTEVADKVLINEGLEVYFRLDAVLQHDNSLWVREKKFSKWRTKDWADSWQLNVQPGLYNHVLHCIAGDRQVKGVEMDGTFFYKNEVKHERAWVSPNADEMEAARWDIISLVEDIYRNIESLKLESPSQPALKSFRKNTEACFAYYNKKCPYYQICNGCSNPLRVLDNNNGEPPTGYVRKFWDPTKVDRFKPFLLPIAKVVPQMGRVRCTVVKEDNSYIKDDVCFSCSSCGTPLFGRENKCRDCMMKPIQTGVKYTNSSIPYFE